MFSLSSLGVPKFGFGKTAAAGTAIDIPKVEVHDIETLVDKRARRLKHLLKLNHTNFSVLYNDLRFHNHTPHILGSAYLLGGSADHLNDVYEDEAKREGHEPWVDSPSEIALHDYRDFLGKREYQRAFIDFFEDQLVVDGYDWQAVVFKFLFETGSKMSPNPLPMFNCMTSGLAHPLIHLGYAFELNSREVAMEALCLVATCYDPSLASFIDTSAHVTATANPLTYSTTNLFDLFARVQADTRLPKFSKPGDDNLSKLLPDKAVTSIIQEHCAAFKVTAPKAQFEQSQRLAAALVISTAPSLHGHGYDFFLVHLLTSSHAVRILLPFLPPKYHIALVREWLFIAIAIYVAQCRPVVKESDVADFDLQGRDWSWAEKLAVNGKHKLDAHYVKAVRAMKEGAKVWGDENEWFLKAAVRFAGEFEGWGGF